VLVVQRLVGHADLRTMARYDRRGEGAKQAAAARLQVGVGRTGPRKKDLPNASHNC
jgi:hypothetical protein